MNNASTFLLKVILKFPEFPWGGVMAGLAYRAFVEGYGKEHR